MDNIEVSIVCLAYNHGDYIRDALDGFVMQKTSFSFEVLIHDDASTDNTADIIREYEKKYPDIIKPIYQAENQYSKKVGIWKTFIYPRAKGRYIALCEGDDYWTDSLKLQKQYDALEKYPNADLCVTGATQVEADTKKVLRYTLPAKESCVIPIEEVLKHDGRFVETATLVYRKAILYDDIECFKKYIYDYPVQVHGALRGGMVYLSDITAAYRYHAKGSWTLRQLNNREGYVKVLKKQCDFMMTLDKDTDYKYTDILQKRIRHDEFRILNLQDDYRGMKSEKYIELYRKMSQKQRTIIFLKYYCPWMLSFILFVKSGIRRIAGSEVADI